MNECFYLIHVPFLVNSLLAFSQLIKSSKVFSGYEKNVRVIW